MDVFLTDFGLARQQPASTPGPAGRAPSKLTGTGAMLGTPAYMSPELARGEFDALTPASDTWALGCVLHECVAGRPAFGGDSAAAVLGAVLGGPLPAPLPGPPAMAALARACLVRNPARRVPTAAALRDDCHRVLAGGRPRARVAGRGRPLAAAVAAAALLAAGAWWAVGPARAPTAPARTAAGVARDHRLRAEAVRHVDPAEAERCYRAALAADPDAHEARLGLGLLCWGAGRSGEARAAWAAVPPGTPAYDCAQLYLGLEGLLRGIEARAVMPADDPALAALRRAGGAVAPLAAAALATAARDDARALALLERQTTWEAALLRAQVLGRREVGAEADALRNWDAVVAAGPPLALAYCNRGSVRLALGDSPGALADSDAAIRMAPAWAPPHCNRGFALTGLGREAEALDAWARALALDPAQPEARLAMAQATAKRGDLAGALAQVDEAIAREPGYPTAHGLRGGILMTQGRHAEALAAFDLAIPHGGNPRWRLFRARCHRQLGHAAEARADLDAFLAQQPDDYEALGERAQLRSAAGNRAGAVLDLDRAIAVDPARPEAWFTRAEAWRMAGDHARAIADAREALARQPDLAQAWATVAMAAAALGRREESDAACREGLRRCPDHPLAAKFARWLREAGAAGGR